MSNILYLFILFSINTFAKDSISSARLNRLSGEQGVHFDTKSRWDQKYNKRSYVYGKAPARFLAVNYDFLKTSSKVLDLGMGEGRNAVFLAQKGHIVTGVDISSVAVKKSKKLAKEFGVRIKGVVASLDTYKIAKGEFDAIICFYYVDRKLSKKIYSWLKPGGILIYEAHTLEERRVKNLKDKREYYLKKGELLSMFPKMKILKYEQPEHEIEYRSAIILKK